MRTVLSLFFFILFILPTTLKSQNSLPEGYMIADSIFMLGKTAEAAPMLRELLKKPSSDSVKGELFMRYGICQRELNQCDSGIYFFKEAVPIWSKQNNKVKLSRTYYNIGNLYVFKKNYREAMPYFKDALGQAQLTADSVKIYIGILVLQLKQNHYDDAYKIIKYRLALFNDDIVPYQSYYIYQGQGVYFLNNNQYDSALFYLKKAVVSTPAPDKKASVFNDIAKVYLGLKNYSEAFRYQDSSWVINSTNNLAENRQFDYDTYTTLYEKTDNFKKALYYAKLGRQLSDSFYDVEKNNAMIDAEAKYQNQKTLAEKAIIEKDNIVKQRNLLFTLVALSLVAILAFFSIRNTRIKQKANKLLTQQKQQVQQLADELGIANQTKARLFSTIGHDLRSPISSLYASLKMQEIRGGNGNEEMSSQTVRLLDTLEELLIWSKSQMDGFVLQPVRVNMYDLFEELKEFYAPAALAENITLVNEAKFNENIYTDEHLLKTILRNALSNAIVNTLSGSSVYLTTYLSVNGTVSLSIQNPCTAEAFQKFKNGFDEAAVKSSAHGYGIVLMKEFAQKINAAIQLSYSAGNAIFKLMF